MLVDQIREAQQGNQDAMLYFFKISRLLVLPNKNVGNLVVLKESEDLIRAML